MDNKKSGDNSFDYMDRTKVEQELGVDKDWSKNLIPKIGENLNIARPMIGDYPPYNGIQPFNAIMDKKDKEIMDLKLRIQQLEESMNRRIINNDLCIGISTDSIIIGYARIVNGQVELNDVLATDVKLYNSNLLPEYLVKIKSIMCDE